MYAGNYGYPNGAPPSQSPHLQPGQAPNPNQQQHQQQQQQHQNQHQQMMYNPQQFPMGPQGPGFPGPPNMMPGNAPAGGMMQNAGMPHMAAANGQMPNYQTPYSNSPYGPGVPSTAAPQMNLPPNYAMGGGMPMSGFPMHPSQMTPQQQQQQQQMMQQRMQPPQPNAGGMPSSTPQRQFPGQGQGPGPQGTPTPNNAPPLHQPQFSTPQHNQGGPPQAQTPNNTHQQQQHQLLTNNIQTPQTPTFPSNVHGANSNGASGSTPLSPGGDSRDKERIAVILEINSELLWEATQLQHTQLMLKKEHASPKGGATPESDKTEEEKLLDQDYIQVMRRLQTNLAYLAQLADKKGSVPAAPSPSYLRPPPISIKVQLKPMPGPDGADSKAEPTDRGETAKYFQELYAKLQGLYPGVDPNKEPSFPPTSQRLGGPGGPNAPKQGSQASPVPGNKKTPKLATSGPPQAQSFQTTPNVTSA